MLLSNAGGLEIVAYERDKCISGILLFTVNCGLNSGICFYINMCITLYLCIVLPSACGAGDNLMSGVMLLRRCGFDQPQAPH